jgi:hypothetical protein
VAALKEEAIEAGMDCLEEEEESSHCDVLA